MPLKKTKAQKVAEKRIYDMAYRAKNRAMLKEKKRAYFLRTYDPKKAAVKRKKRMHLHVAYCRQPRYKAWKRQYDLNYRARALPSGADEATQTAYLSIAFSWLLRSRGERALSYRMLGWRVMVGGPGVFLLARRRCGTSYSTWPSTGRLPGCAASRTTRTPR
jgi:hypothetical protein